MSIAYVNTNAGGYFGYPDVLRVTFAEPSSFLLFLSVGTSATDQLQADIDNLAGHIGRVAGVAIASDPTVAPGSSAVTIDFAPLEPVAQLSVATVLQQIQDALSGALEFVTNTQIVRVERVNANSAQGQSGAIARGTDTGAAAAAADSAFSNNLSSIFGGATKFVLIAAAVGALFVFAPEIKAGVRAVSRGRKAA